MFGNEKTKQETILKQTSKWLSPWKPLELICAAL